MASDDLYQEAEWKAYAKHFTEVVLPNLTNSAIAMHIAADAGELDVQAATELGASIMLDKPIIAIVIPGTNPAPKLLNVADEVIHIDPKREPGKFQELMLKAMRRLGLERFPNG